MRSGRSVTDEIPQLINAYECGNFTEIGRLALDERIGRHGRLAQTDGPRHTMRKAVKADQAETILGSIQEIKEFVTCVNEREMQRKSIESSLKRKDKGICTTHQDGEMPCCIGRLAFAVLHLETVQKSAVDP